MHLDSASPIRLAVATRDELGAVLRELVLRTGCRAETVAGYAVACALWGLVVYVALAAALH